MAEGPTIYRRATTKLPAREPSAHSKRMWIKHRKKAGKSTTLPKPKTN